MARHPIAVSDALPIARQIVDALEAAHELGIVHGDLKPANIKVRPDGTVKVLDFGLVKAVEGEAVAPVTPNSPTLSAAATRAGVILGTAAYMAPEQARGKQVDKRADVWAFGCLLFEMLTGTRAFAGDECPIRLPPFCAENLIGRPSHRLRLPRSVACFAAVSKRIGASACKPSAMRASRSSMP